MIILLGLPKSGTTSFHSLFKTLGYTSFHWKKNGKFIGKMIENNKMNKKPLLNDFEESDVITQMDICIDADNCYWPQVIDFKQIIEENQDAIFILNTRHPDKILSSFKKWGTGKKSNKYGSFYERIFKFNPELFECDEKSDTVFINFVKKFYNNIETYFKKNKHLKFISYHINNDKIDKLKKYIDIKDIKIFPRKNVNLEQKLKKKKSS